MLAYAFMNIIINFVCSGVVSISKFSSECFLNVFFILSDMFLPEHLSALE